MVIVDNGIHLAQYEVKKIVEIKEKERQKKIKEQAMLDHAVQRRRITTMKGIFIFLIINRSWICLLLGVWPGPSDY